MEPPKPVPASQASVVATGEPVSPPWPGAWVSNTTRSPLEQPVSRAAKKQSQSGKRRLLTWLAPLRKTERTRRVTWKRAAATSVARGEAPAGECCDLVCDD